MILDLRLLVLLLVCSVLPFSGFAFDVGNHAGAAEAESSPRPVIAPASDPAAKEPDARGGRVLRFPDLDLRVPGGAFQTDGRPVWTFREDRHGRPAYVLEFSDQRYAPFTDWSTSARHPLPLLPNRSSVSVESLVRVLVAARPARRPAGRLPAAPARPGTRGVAVGLPAARLSDELGASA